MSESEGKRELVGLARSIDALFSGGAARSGAATPEPDFSTAPSADTLVLPALDVAEAAVEAGPAEPYQPDAVVPREPESAPEEPEPEPQPEVQDPAPSSAETLVLPTLEVAEAEVDAGAAEAREAAEVAVPEPKAPAEPAGDDDEPAPGPLDLAVEEHLVGVPTAADQIRTLAAELTETREIEPIARSVARLTIAAGDPPDRATLALATELASPIVLRRLARRIGVERDEQRRAEYFAMCSTLGVDMALAIRDELGGEADRLARRIYREALREMGEVSRGVVEEMAEDENRFLVKHAVVILGETGGGRAVELVTSQLAHPDPGVRWEALLALVKLGDHDAGQLVLALLEDTDQRVRMAAATAAGELKVERALRAVIAMLDGSTDPDEYSTLLRALGRLGDPGAVPSIEKHAVRTLFSKPRTDVRIAAFQALSHLGTPRAEELLKNAIHDKEEDVREVVRRIMRARRDRKEEPEE